MRKIFFVSFVFLLSACAPVMSTPTNTPTSSPTDIPMSGIEGQVFIGPICPIARVGQECPDEPYQALLSVTSPTGKRIVQVQTDENGQFKIPLEPGEYILHPESPDQLPFASDQNIIVENGKFTEVIVNFDSGIR